MGLWSNWAITQVINGEIKTEHWFVFDMEPLNFAFDRVAMVHVGKKFISGKVLWGVGRLNITNTDPYFKEIEEPIGLDLYLKEDEYSCILWSTHYIESTGSYQLHRRDTNTYFYIYNNVTSTSIGEN